MEKTKQKKTGFFSRTFNTFKASDDQPSVNQSCPTTTNPQTLIFKNFHTHTHTLCVCTRPSNMALPRCLELTI